MEQQVAELEKVMNCSDFWNDSQGAQKVIKETNRIKAQLEADSWLEEMLDEQETYQLMLDEDFSQMLLDEAVEALQIAIPKIDKAEVRYILNGKTDINNAILTIHPGAGGTESQDWAEMLFRMYKRWADSNNCKCEVIDFINGDEAGIKSVTIEIFGDYAFGYLKSEIGVHRLVRISPFNAQGKRQTSFASVFVYPMIEDDINLEISPADLRIDTYRASGKGGQGVNTTDSAVRITHIPTNIVVQCQNQRSQIKNRDGAMKVLKARLYQYYEEQREKERAKLEDTKTDIGWGNQIRSYVFHPYQMVKDHRTNFESGNLNAVMDGDLNGFMNAYLKYNAGKNN